MGLLNIRPVSVPKFRPVLDSIIKEFSKYTRSSPGTGYTNAIICLVTELREFCHESGLDFDDVVKASKMQKPVFERKKNEED